MGGFGLILNACVCLNGMYSCIPCSFCKFTQVEPSSRSAHQHARHTSYMTSDTTRHLGTSVDQPTDFDDGLPSYDEIFMLFLRGSPKSIPTERESTGLFYLLASRKRAFLKK